MRSTGPSTGCFKPRKMAARRRITGGAMVAAPAGCRKGDRLGHGHSPAKERQVSDRVLASLRAQAFCVCQNAPVRLSNLAGGRTGARVVGVKRSPSDETRLASAFALPVVADAQRFAFPSARYVRIDHAPLRGTQFKQGGWAGLTGFARGFAS